jgi:hypothetical protein
MPLEEEEWSAFFFFFLTRTRSKPHKIQGVFFPRKIERIKEMVGLSTIFCYRILSKMFLQQLLTPSKGVAYVLRTSLLHASRSSRSSRLLQKVSGNARSGLQRRLSIAHIILLISF